MQAKKQQLKILLTIFFPISVADVCLRLQPRVKKNYVIKVTVCFLESEQFKPMTRPLLADSENEIQSTSKINNSRYL